MTSSTVPPQNVLDSDWDVLVVLDAARYDTFAERYEKYFSGDLEKRRSNGSATPEWAAKTFTGSHDLTYLSANPFVNSFGIPLNELRWGASAGYDWTAADHIANVVDVWHDEWDEELKTVTPRAVTDAARECLDDGYDGRLVVHYLQPHAPYLRAGKGRKLERIKAGFDDVSEAEAHPYRRRVQAVVDRVRTRVEPLLGESELAMKAGMLVELDPTRALDAVTSGVGASLRRHYEENLQLALEEAAALADDLDGDVVVTSDHGEAFGEQGVWEHHVETHIPALVEVPWLRLD